MSLFSIPTSSPINASFSSLQCQSSKLGRDRLTIESVPLSYNDLHDCLLKENLVGPEVPRPVSNPPLKWYNANENCKYLMDARGHSIEKCISFKVHVKRLKDAGEIKFNDIFFSQHNTFTRGNVHTPQTKLCLDSNSSADQPIPYIQGVKLRTKTRY